jgi:hypothetical protein
VIKHQCRPHSFRAKLVHGRAGWISTRYRARSFSSARSLTGPHAVPFQAAQHPTSGNRDGSKANATERRKRLAWRATMAQGARFRVGDDFENAVQ